MRTVAGAMSRAPSRFVEAVGAVCVDGVRLFGDLTLFFGEMLAWLVTRLPRAGVLLPALFEIGLLSLPMVMLTGAFIGMVIAVQTIDQFRFLHLESNLGATINLSLVRELGPVLTATMLAGRVGGAMAAELGTMKITEQIDALRVLGANPMQHLVVPRFIACVVMIPLLALFADGAGVCRRRGRGRGLVLRDAGPGRQQRLLVLPLLDPQRIGRLGLRNPSSPASASASSSGRPSP